ncbi:hypothetical protein [Fodinicola acaciae]|uniref:hypothetical protein n=1 Tax=Fodinicola acaciae TaxID=2681555 RepID=UPI0013D5BDED|nr:hypothetical protein [Fodinicola acaciae]
MDGLRWLWIGEQPERSRALLGNLLQERNRICVLLEEADASCPILNRWLMPLPDLADLTGQSMSWLDVAPIPDENELLEDFLQGSPSDESLVWPGRPQEPLLRRVRMLLDVPGLRGAVMVLAHAGHGNYLGLQSSLTADGTPGHDLRPDHEALFMHVSAIGVIATLLGTVTVAPEQWPADVPKETFLQTAIDCTEEVASVATRIHRLNPSKRTQGQARKSRVPVTRPLGIIRGAAIVAQEDILPDVNTADDVASAAEAYFSLARSMPIRPHDYGEPSLHAILAFGGAHSSLQTVMSTYNRPGSAVIAVFAARMLLEEAARLVWRISIPNEAAFEARAKQFFDEYRARRKRTVNTLVGSGIRRADAENILALPENVKIVTPTDEIAKNRTPLPSISSMLRAMGAPYPEPGWLQVAYTLLSQTTHSTPVGLLHAVRVRGGLLEGNELSVEMLGLTLDVACLGSAVLIGHAAVLITDVSDQALQFRKRLLGEAAKVHNEARLVHGLD